jgi:uncharacterized membrane protein YdjX (TVP38/TMEM64 family)
MSDDQGMLSGGDDERPPVSLPYLLMRGAMVLVLLLSIITVVWLKLTWTEGEDLSSRIRFLFELARHSPWAPLVVTSLLVLLNVAGVPLLILTAGVTYVVDDVGAGFAYAWCASMIGACIGFWLGYYSGARLLRDFGGDQVNVVSRRLGRRGIMASFLIRMVPTAPAIVVNMVIGASHIEFWKFVAGTGAGIAPKLLLIAVVTAGLISLNQADWKWVTAGLAALVALWLVTMWVLRRYVQKQNGAENGDGSGDMNH